ncbi:hypothetical protein ZIOFF_035927 [Zingiber officinale]|uniref:MSP domain-containing protein n=1 Tax=Zingiber officinale TaxID=94328 RepID=A0A8J5GD78_ZINOF|nr:hypothetical protein ZIOFF_035927 [Zingiber officinale]
MISGGLLKIYPSELKLPCNFSFFLLFPSSKLRFRLESESDLSAVTRFDLLCFPLMPMGIELFFGGIIDGKVSLGFIVFLILTVFVCVPSAAIIVSRSRGEKAELFYFCCLYSLLVTMQAQKEVPPDLQCKDKFLIQSVATDDGTTTKDITTEMFNKVPGKVVEEFKLRAIYIPANPPSPVPEESEEGGSPHSSMLDNEVQSSTLFDAASRSLEESSRENEVEMLAQKLTEEKEYALQQNQKLRQELELLRKQQNRGGFSISFVAVVAFLCIIIGYLFRST